jgi:acetyl esterase/lipase
VLGFALAAAPARAQERVDKNVVYGMYSGLALVMDVHHPQTPNGYGVVFVAGSGWQAQLSYGAPALKESQIPLWGPPLLRAGYTVFAVNHRAAPRFHYPAAVEDVQRAVRFVRHHAARFGVNPARIGGVGGSSGAHLIGLVAMLAAPGATDDPDPVNRQPATLQCIVLRAAPSDLKGMTGGGGTGTAAVVSFLDRAPTPDAESVYRSASPLTHVSRSSPPALLLHGDSDDVVPYQQSVALEAALAQAGVTVKLVRVAGGEHGADFGIDGKPHQQLPEVLRETVNWLDRHLRGEPAAKQ